MQIRDFLNRLDVAKQLVRVNAPVSCDLELAALCRHEFQRPEGGNALLFSNLDGSDYVAAANLFGSEQRMLQILASESFVDFAVKLRRVLEQKDFLKRSFHHHDVGLDDAGLQRVDCSELDRLPVIRSWPAENGGHLTLALTVTADIETGQQNLGLYRAQLLKQGEIAVNFAPDSGAGRHLQIAQSMNRKMRIALVFGGALEYIWAAAAPLPADWNEFALCQKLFSSSDRFVRLSEQDLLVPADVELVIAGEIDPNRTCIEGPFGNHTGQYVSRSDCPLMQVAVLFRKDDPLFPLTVVGPPPSENINLAKANEILIRELLTRDFPQISDVGLPLDTFFHGACLLSVKADKTSKYELIKALWQSSPIGQAKIMILLDEDIDLNSWRNCWWRAVNRLDVGKVYQSQNRLAIDATGVDPNNLVTEDRQTRNNLRQRFPGFGL